MTAESFAQFIIARELERTVYHHDDGSEPSMYDLRVGPSEAPDIAIECVRAVDRIKLEAWKAGPEKGPMFLNLLGNWIVVSHPTARMKAIRSRIESVLQYCESSGLTEFTPVDCRLKRSNEQLFHRLASLQIESISCYQTAGEGKVSLTVSGVGGIAHEMGDAVPGWVAGFLRSPKQRDVISKLERSGAPECHVFVPVSFDSVPWEVESYLQRLSDVTPTSAPDLPEPVIAVWITYADVGLRWDGSAWRTFDARVSQVLGGVHSPPA